MFKGLLDTIQCPLNTEHPAETSLIVPDFTMFINSSSCNYVSQFGPIFAPLLSLSIFWLPQGRVSCIEKEKKKELHKLPYTEIDNSRWEWGRKKRELHELPYTEIDNSSRERGRKKERIAWTAVHRNWKIRDY